jgi:hypothetical protein
MVILCNILHLQKKEAESRFVNGPLVSSDFWDHERATLDIDHGPCNESMISNYIQSTKINYQEICTRIILKRSVIEKSNGSSVTQLHSSRTIYMLQKFSLMEKVLYV